jgi:hypothetical protein
MTASLQTSCSRPPRGRLITAAAAAAVLFLFLIASPVAAAPQKATDQFVGTANLPAGQSSPVQIDPSDVVARPDGAIGIGYRYQAAGLASGQIAGKFEYHEHGYLFFTNPADPTTLVGSRFASGIFTLAPSRGGAPIQIADTAPDRYTSGIETVATKIGPVASKNLRNLVGHAGPMTFGYFTFTNARGTFTGYATPDFTRFSIEIAFDLPN